MAIPDFQTLMLPFLHECGDQEMRTGAMVEGLAQVYLARRIVLIDGETLARLMIRFGVGRRVEETLHIKKVDEDFFE